LSIRERLGRLQGVNVSIIGDIAHSRVVRSNIHLLTKMKANVTLAAPPTLIPSQIEEMGVRVSQMPIGFPISLRTKASVASISFR